SLAAPTASSMVRRAEFSPGDTAIVASARSSTGISLIRTLLVEGIQVIAVSSNKWTVQEQKLIDPHERVHFLTIDHIHEIEEHSAAAVFDFFTDKHFGSFVSLLKDRKSTRLNSS